MVTATGARGTLTKVAMDQLLYAPCFISVFMGSLAVLEGRAHEAGTIVRDNIWSTLCVNWGLWTPAQMINFYVMPLRYQVLFSNFVALVWNSFLSWKTHQE